MPSPPPPSDEDPLLTNARRELWMILAAFAALIVWCVGCYLYMGLNRPENRPLNMILGIPDWVFWGVVAPWGVSVLFTTWFCFGFMVDDSVGSAGDEMDAGQDRDADASGEQP